MLIATCSTLCSFARLPRKAGVRLPLSYADTITDAEIESAKDALQKSANSSVYVSETASTSPAPSYPLDAPPSAPATVFQVIGRLVRHPGTYLLRRWNWKSAVLSSLLRACIFFCTNLAAGFPAAIAAMKTELVFRAITSGFYGAITQSFGEAEPPWAAALAVMILLPFANHSIELLVHWLRGTQKLFVSIVASVIFTALSSLFNWYAMRRGSFIVGQGRSSLGKDFLALPRLLYEFVVLLPYQFARGLARRFSI
jgi:hypothetical protein